MTKTAAPQTALAGSPTAAVRIRTAVPPDLSALEALLADDVLGIGREVPGDPAYAVAFAAILKQIGNSVLVAEDADGRITGCLQLTLIPGLSHRGLLRAQIEGVRVASDRRGIGIGECLVNHAIMLAREAGAGLIQLTTDNIRTDAHRFYLRLGFTPTHTGMKLPLISDS